MKYITALSVVTTLDLPLSRRTAIVQELQHIKQKIQTKHFILEIIRGMQNHPVGYIRNKGGIGYSIFTFD